MKKQICVSLVMLASSFAFASGDFENIKCEGQYDGQAEVIQLKIGNDGKVVKWSKKHMTKAKTPYLGGLAQDLDQYGYEWVKNIRAQNGATILEMGTTADSFTLAISGDRKRASFAYHDLGSGAGNHSFGLACEASN